MKKQRMYAVVLRHLSGKDKGIQAWHCGQEYANKYWESKKFQRWAKIDKTITVLEAGTSAQLAEVNKKLKKLGVGTASFVEPDIEDTTTGIAFVVDDRVSPRYGDVDDVQILQIRNVLKNCPLASN